MEITAAEIARITGGKLLCGDPATVIRHVALDSRVMSGDDLFVPTRGEKADGHRFIEGAFAKGAAATLTDEHDAAGGDRPWIRVEDTFRALQTLGAAFRRSFKGPVIGITGSVGKTTTRELTKAALAAGGSVTGNEKNMNSQLGLPVTLCQMDYSADRAVLEMGISVPGEMKRLVAMAHPHTVLVTNIGVAHIENMGSREAICEEKMHIADELSSCECAILNGEEPLLRAYENNGRFRTVYYGRTADCDIRAEEICLGEETSFTAVFSDCVTGTGFSVPVRLSVPGEHNVLNALAALGAAAVLGIDVKAAAEKLSLYGGFHRRLERLTVGDLKIIDDSYNASPVSMKAALEVLTVSGRGRRIAVLADMLELGPDSPAMHREVGEYAASLPIDLFITLGEQIRETEEPLKAAGRTVLHAADQKEAAALVRQHTGAGDTLLLKGSNGMRLDLVLEELKK